MRTINFNFNKGIIRVVAGTAMASLIFVGATLAQTSRVNHRKAKNNLAHHTKVAGKDTARATDRTASKTARFTKRTARGTGKAVDRASSKTARTVKRGSEDMAHDTKVAGKKTGRFFRRVGHAIY